MAECHPRFQLYDTYKQHTMYTKHNLAVGLYSLRSDVALSVKTKEKHNSLKNNQSGKETSKERERIRNGSRAKYEPIGTQL